MEHDKNDYSYGTIKCYYPLKGYGFITRPKGRDVLFHRFDIEEEASIIEGASVKFTIVQNKKGPQAKNITRNG